MSSLQSLKSVRPAKCFVRYTSRVHGSGFVACGHEYGPISVGGVFSDEEAMFSHVLFAFGPDKRYNTFTVRSRSRILNGSSATTTPGYNHGRPFGFGILGFSGLFPRGKSVWTNHFRLSQKRAWRDYRNSYCRSHVSLGPVFRTLSPDVP